jgi:hypothetical protein
MMPGREVTGKWHLTADCPAGGKHEWESTQVEEESESELRSLQRCKKCGEGLWHVVTKYPDQ